MRTFTYRLLTLACCFFIPVMLLLPGTSKAQVLTYSDLFTNGVTPSTTQAANWNAYRSTLVAANPYYKVKLYGTGSTSFIECNVPSIVQDIALKLRTGVAATWIDGANTWNVGVCAVSGTEWELSVNSGNCSCPSPGFVVRPGIGNLNWGGIGTATCSGPTQTMTVEFWYGPPCPPPTAPYASGILSSAATVGWAPVTGSVGYEYVVNTNSADPTGSGTPTSSTSVNLSGLNPSTTYYLHVRNKCSSTSASVWVTFSFTTLPPCYPPVGFNVTNLTPNSATINWAVWPSALDYDYIVDQSNTTPTSTTAATNTTLTTANLSALLENTWYFVHIRSNCALGEKSGWSLDSFLTPIPCRAPVITIDHINTTEAVAYWAPVVTAVSYEYAITKSPTPPVLGTKYDFTSIHTSALDDGQDYYIHARSQCVCLGIQSTSPWGTASFKTFPTNVNNAGGAGFRIAAFPNPIKDVMTIQVSGTRDGEATITVTEVSGKVVRSVNVLGEKTNVDMGGLAAGMYMVKYTDQSHSEMIKINKQ